MSANEYHFPAAFPFCRQLSLGNGLRRREPAPGIGAPGGQTVRRLERPSVT
jgi:hypothetical protein